jgi:hypothetical protein
LRISRKTIRYGKEVTPSLIDSWFMVWYWQSQEVLLGVIVEIDFKSKKGRR